MKFSQNKRITPKDRNAIKGAIRRAFARSELRNKVINDAEVKHSDPKRPRVKRWVMCAICKKPEARSYMQADHLEPLVKIDSSLEDMTPNELVHGTWCEEENLQPVCVKCHKIKSLGEQQERKRLKKLKKESKSNG